MTDRITELLIDECRRFYKTFCSFSEIAKFQFEQQLWHDQRNANIRRLELSDQHRDFCKQKLQAWLSDGDVQAIWKNACRDIFQMDHALPAPVLQSFVIAVERSLYPMLAPDEKYFSLDFNTRKQFAEVKQLPFADYEEMAKQILDCPRFTGRFRDLREDCNQLAKNLVELDVEIRDVLVYPNPFFRNKHAYLVGLIRTAADEIPLGIAFVNEAAGIRADAFLFSEEELIRIFEFTRSYILNATEDPEGLFAFLIRVMPTKNLAQLIINLGYKEWGKVLLQKEFEQHLRNGSLKLNHAPGIRGMVMLVFTSAKYPMVFKLIRDKIAYPKETTPVKVLEKYRLVARHDRVGRLADTQLYQYWSFPEEVFPSEFLREIMDTANQSVEVKGKNVILRRIFIERKMVPLNIFLEEKSGPDIREVIIDYGNAIKDLAMSNIFPGDLLTKNFGVTSNNRVVFYDYDEVMKLTECNFKTLPPPRNEEEMWDAENWTVARDNDIFPEELLKFIIPSMHRELFLEHHADLFTPDFWNHWKRFHEMEGFMDLQPY